MTFPPLRRAATAITTTVLLATLAGCTFDQGSRASVDTEARSNSNTHTLSLRFIGEQRIAWRQEFGGTTVGGLSGIAYEPRSDSWVIVTDDRSAINPARFYTARLRYDARAFDSVYLTGVTFLKQADGSLYPNLTDYQSQNSGGEVPDFESIRFDPLDGSLWHTSEGDRKLGSNPFVRHVRRNGDYIATMPLPAMFRVPPPAATRGVRVPVYGTATPATAAPARSGMRDNMGFEGLSFAPDGQSYWVSVEGPLMQDGAEASPTEGGYSRITRFDRSGNMLAQYAYRLEPVPALPGPGKAAVNGISEILAVNEQQVLVLERAAVQAADGRYRNYIRLYQMDVRGATDVRDLAALADTSFTPASKRLVLDLDTLGLPQVDNVEGMAWGRKLANGHDTLLLMSDDNFNQSEVTQFLLFEASPDYPRLQWWKPWGKPATASDKK
jgi:hypothetical protein